MRLVVLALCVLIALFGLASAHPEDEVGETKVCMEVLPTLGIIPPGCQNMPEINVPETSEAASPPIAGAVKATNDWVLEVKEDPPGAEDGYMATADGSKTLSLPFVVDIEDLAGNELGRVTLTGSKQELLSGGPGKFDYIFTFEQPTQWGDRDGEYKITVSYYIRVSVSAP